MNPRTAAKDEAVAKAMDPQIHRAKAEQLFYLLKALADDGWVGDPIVKVAPYFRKANVLILLRQLEKAGAIEKMWGGSKCRTIVGVRFLAPDVSVRLGKSGKKTEKREVSEIKKEEKKSICSSAKRTLVFLDENEFIRASRTGISFDLNNILNKVSEKIGRDPLRVFFYVSAETERRACQTGQKLFACERPEMRYIKTVSRPGEVDRKMRDDIVLWSQTGVIDQIILGTADGGPEFQSAIAEAKARGIEVVLLEVAGVFNQTLSEQVNDRINATPPNFREIEFKGLVYEARVSGRIDRQNLNASFLLAIVKELNPFFQQHQEARFMKIVEWIWARIGAKWNPRGYSVDDARVVIAALYHPGHVLKGIRRYDSESGRKNVKLYRLCNNSTALKILTS